MLNIKLHTEYIEREIQKLDFPKEPNGLYEPIRYHLKFGGKRIRPVLTILGAELFGKTKEDVINQALSIEIFHNFTLVHDDIMDDAPLRRNQETIHKKWCSNTAILSGDIMMIKSFQLLSKVSENHIPALFDVFNKTAVEVCEGQQMDMDFEDRNDVTIEEYIEMIRLKTSVLLGAALDLGAIVAGASKEDVSLLRKFGENIGVAFQIQDDILDLFADPDKFGKQVGGDVIANKKTLLHLTALNKANKEQIELLNQLQNENDSKLKVSQTKEIYSQLSVKDSCNEHMNKHLNIALDSLAKINAPDNKKEDLMKLAQFLIVREL